MMMLSMKWLAILSTVTVCGQTPSYNRDVRPILSDRCYACHGPDNNNRKANFRIDQSPGADGIRKALERVRSTNKSKRMPPEYLGHAPLKESEIQTLEAWAAAGATYEKHWSLIPPRKAPVPAGVNPVDHFIDARLAREGLPPNPQATEQALIRRVTLDLTGLPPAVEEQTSGETYEARVDRLLGSKRYAERMAIRWLEAARYADTNGYQTDGVRSMWRWRDWVLNAFARNMPFDQFTIEQLAGDLLPGATRDQKIATGFHRNHRTSAEGGIIDEEFRVEYVADRAETTATVWMGLTAGCARCHDHKYDPISQKDFYRLFAFFNQVPEKGFVYNFGNEEPYLPAPTPEMEAKLAEHDARLAAAEAEWRRLQPKIEEKIEKSSARYQPPPGWLPSEGLVFRHSGGSFTGGDGLTAGFEQTKLNYLDPFTFRAVVQSSASDGAILSKSEDYWEGTGHGLYLVDGRVRLHIVFRWTDLGMRVETKNRVDLSRPREIRATYDGKRKPGGIHIYVDGEEQELSVLFNELSWPIESKEPFRIGAGGGKRFQGEIRDVAVWSREVPPEEFIRRAYFAWLDQKAPPEIREARQRWKQARRDRDAYFATIPTVMVMQDQPGIRKNFVLKRGAYDQHGEEVEAGVPSSLPPLDPSWPVNRLGLARWLVSRENPLTARVTVNRLWQMLFGVGLVKTVEDFGSQGEWPLHPELLDWLAVELMDSGWDLRHVLRTIVLSDTYRRSAAVTPELLARDPENRLYARAPRLRLSAEEIRDQALAASGLLVDQFGGPSVRPPQPPGLWNELAGGKDYEADTGEGRYRRSLYTYWRRTIQPPAMVTFDSPTRETCSVRESRTNTPLQALNLMNDETYLEASAALAERMRTAPDPVGEGFRRVLGRDPQPREREIVSRLKTPAGWTRAASLLLNLDEALTKP
jgi:cytochrome c553